MKKYETHGPWKHYRNFKGKLYCTSSSGSKIWKCICLRSICEEIKINKWIKKICPKSLGFIWKMMLPIWYVGHIIYLLTVLSKQLKTQYCNSKSPRKYTCQVNPRTWSMVFTKTHFHTFISKLRADTWLRSDSWQPLGSLNFFCLSGLLWFCNSCTVFETLIKLKPHVLKD